VKEQATSRVIVPTENHQDHPQRRTQLPTYLSGNKQTSKRNEQQLQQPKFNYVNCKRNSWKRRERGPTDTELNKISRNITSLRQRTETGKRQTRSDWKYKQLMNTSDRDTRRLVRKMLKKLLPLHNINNNRKISNWNDNNLN
jgi:hypothetical protein